MEGGPENLKILRFLQKSENVLLSVQELIEGSKLTRESFHKGKELGLQKGFLEEKGSFLVMSAKGKKMLEK